MREMGGEEWKEEGSRRVGGGQIRWREESGRMSGAGGGREVEKRIESRGAGEERAGLGLRGAEGGDNGSRERVVGGVETGCSQWCTSIILSLTVSKLPALV